jgi:hypothetical protein
MERFLGCDAGHDEQVTHDLFILAAPYAGLAVAVT